MHQPLTIHAQTLLLALNQSPEGIITLPSRTLTLDDAHRERAAQELTGQGLAASTSRYSGHALLRITAHGRSRAESLSYTYPGQMRARSILTTLHDRQALPEPPGGSAEEREQYETMNYLIANRLVAVDVDGALSAPFPSPRLTPLGRQCLASGYGPQDFITEHCNGGNVTNTGDHYTIGSIHATGQGQVGIGRHVTFHTQQQHQLAALDALENALNQAEPTPETEHAHNQARADLAVLRDKALTGARDGVQEGVDELARNATTATGFAALGLLQAVGHAFLTT